MLAFGDALEVLGDKRKFGIGFGYLPGCASPSTSGYPIKREIPSLLFPGGVARFPELPAPAVVTPFPE